MKQQQEILLYRDLSMRERERESNRFLFSAEGAGQEEESVWHKLYPDTPNSNIELGLATQMASEHLEKLSVSSVASSSSILDKTAFLSDVGC